MNRDVQVVANAEAIFRAAAQEWIRLAAEAVKARNSFSVALSGGSTPKGLFTLLATDAALRSQAPWEKTHFFWGDERHVPPDHAESNYRMAYEAMLSKVPAPAANVHRIHGEYSNAAQAASEYENELRQFFHLAAGELPRFDLVLLGMGPDGHTASLFPGSAALEERQRMVVSNWVEKFHTDRITFTYPALNNAANVIFLTGGADKTEMLRAVLTGKPQSVPYPSERIQPTHGRLLWLVDEAAARLWKQV
jgi:6-phosphogluconolactonase